MITSLLNNTCQIDNRQEDTRDDWGEFDYTPETVDCLYLDLTDYKAETENDIANVSIGVFYLKEEITQSDKIIFEEYSYDITSSGVMKVTSLFSGEIEYYKVYVSKRRKFNEKEIRIDSRVD